MLIQLDNDTWVAAEHIASLQVNDGCVVIELTTGLAHPVKTLNGDSDYDTLSRLVTAVNDALEKK